LRQKSNGLRLPTRLYERCAINLRLYFGRNISIKEQKMRARKVNRRTFLHVAGAASSVGLAGGIAAQMGLGDSMLLGISRCMLPIPRMIWKSQVPEDRKALDFMTQDHHRIRDFVVVELPRVGKPLSPQFIAQALNLPLAKVTDILSDLELHMTFLFRNEQGEVVWAYPVTAEVTPHHVTFSSGEQIYAA
jgi:hypothetical protein